MKEKGDNSTLRIEVAENVMGWKGLCTCGDERKNHGKFWHKFQPDPNNEPLPDYPNSIADAFLVVEAMRKKGFGYMLGSPNTGPAICNCSFYNQGEEYFKAAATLPMAISLAALEAVKAKDAK